MGTGGGKEAGGFWIAAHVAGAALLLWVAFANGFPLLFADSGGYLRIGTELYYPLDRPAVYGLMIAPFARLGGLWAVAAAQALFTAWIIGMTLEAVTGRRSAGVLLAVLAALAAFSSLPWFSGQIMPDLFTGLSALLLFLILFGPERAGWRRWALPIQLAGLIATHLSHLMIAAALIAVGMAVIARRHGTTAALHRGGPAVAALAASLAGLCTMNLVAEHHFRPSLQTEKFLVARLFDGKVGQPVLDRLCAREPWMLCAVRPMVNDPARALPGQDYLWAADSPRGPLEASSPNRFRAEEAAFASRVLHGDPAGVLRLALRGWRQQIVRSRAADGMIPYGPETQVTRQVKTHFPASYPPFLASLEQRDGLRSLAVFPDRGLALLIVLAMPAILWLGLRRRDDPLIGLAAIVLATLLVNAAVCGMLSGPADRYQSRTLWLLPLLGCIALARLRPPAAGAGLRP